MRFLPSENRGGDSSADDTDMAAFDVPDEHHTSESNLLL